MHPDLTDSVTVTLLEKYYLLLTLMTLVPYSGTH